jgi:DNA-binding CsgD family transcriptional regulator
VDVVKEALGILAADEDLDRRLRLGAHAETARAELARIGGRAPARGALTESERRIAALVAQGRTNREVAAALFVTEHTVATALTRVYGKLGVRSRTELASRLPGQKQDSRRANT